MAKDPRDRYPSAGDLGRAALAATQDRATTTGERSVATGDASPDSMLAIAPTIPLPPALAVETGRGPFVGRETLLETLATRYAAAEAGQRQFVLLAGEPGIGKTRLATELARRAHREGATVLYGRSDPESIVPYQPFIAALDHYVANREQLVLPAELALELTELARFVPGLRKHVPDAARAARRGARDAPLPPLRGRHADARVRRPRAPGGAAARRPALGRRLDARCCSATCSRTRRRCACWCSAPRATSRASC